MLFVREGHCNWQYSQLAIQSTTSRPKYSSCPFGLVDNPWSQTTLHPTPCTPQLQLLPAQCITTFQSALGNHLNRKGGMTVLPKAVRTRGA